MRVWQRALDGSLVRILSPLKSHFGLYTIGGKRDWGFAGGIRFRVIHGFALVLQYKGETIELRNMSANLIKGGRYHLSERSHDRLYDAMLSVCSERSLLDYLHILGVEIPSVFVASPQLFRKAKQ